MALRFRLLVLGVLFLHLTIPAIFTYRNRHAIVSHLKTWRASSLASKAGRHGQAGEWIRARRLALSAHQLDPHSLPAIRQAFAACLAKKSPQLRDLASALYHHDQATFEDRLQVMKLFLLAGDVLTFKRMYNQLSREEKNTIEALDLIVLYHARRGEYKEALSALEKLRRLRNDPADRLVTAEIYIQMADKAPEHYEQAQHLIQQLFLDGTEKRHSLAAFSLLNKIPGAHWKPVLFSQSRDRLRALAGSGGIAIRHDILAEEIQARLDRKSLEDILPGIVFRWTAAEPVYLSQWLLARGQTGAALAILEKQDTSRSGELYRAHVQTLLLAGKWDETEALLEKAPPGMRRFEVYALSAAAAEAKGEKSKAKMRWERAIESASLSKSRDELLQVAHLARKAGNTAVCKQAVRKAMRQRSAIPLTSDDLGFYYASLAENNEAEELLHSAKTMLAADPENHILLNNVAWLEIVLGTFHPQDLPVIRERLERYPRATALQTTLALALCESGQPDKALQVLHESGLRSMTVTDAAVLSLALHQADRREESTRLASKIDWSAMMIAERDYFQGALLE